MNRSYTTLAVSLTALAFSAPAQAASGPSDGALALQYSARADVALKTGLDLARSGDATRARMTHVLATAHSFETRAAAAAERTLARGRQAGAAAIKSAGRVIVRLDKAGRTELAVMRASSDKQVQQQAAGGVDLSASLTSSLNAKVSQSAVDGGSGSQAAATAVNDARAASADVTVQQIKGTLPSVRSDQARAKLDHAISVLTPATPDNTGASASTGSQDGQAPASASANAGVSGTASLGQVASTSSVASTTATATHAPPKP
jgi:hypothetical protein